ncbi:hypothetical protein [Methylobacterium durans]|nr:hypothetical protein [Methylobacterium durans]
MPGAPGLDHPDLRGLRRTAMLTLLTLLVTGNLMLAALFSIAAAASD